MGHPILSRDTGRPHTPHELSLIGRVQVANPRTNKGREVKSAPYTQDHKAVWSRVMSSCFLITTLKVV